MRRGIELWDRDELEPYLALFEEFAGEDFEFHPVIAQAVEGERRIYRGIDGVRRFWMDSHAVFDLRFGETEIRDLGDRLVVLGQVSATGRGSGLDIETPFAMVVDYEGERRTRIVQYLDHDEALEAAGAAD